MKIAIFQQDERLKHTNDLCIFLRKPFLLISIKSEMPVVTPRLHYYMYYDLPRDIGI